jgi:type IV pilus assembly protein PilN
MIRINLMGVPKAKRGKRPAMPALEGGGPNPLMVALVLLMITAAGNFGWWFKLDRDAKKIAAEMTKAEQENRELLQVKARVEEKNKQAELYQRRVDVIGRLRAQQSGPRELLAMLGDTVNGTEAVWLSRVNDEGNNIAIEGMALSVHAVANLMTNLKRTGHFKNIEIKESYQDDTVRDMQAFIFTLQCEKKLEQKKT